MPMIKFRSPLTVFATLIFASLASRAQELGLTVPDLGLTVPGRLTLYRPITGTYQGEFIQRPLTLSLGASIGYDDNVNTAHDNRVGSGYTAPRVDIASSIGSERTRLKADLRLGFTGYWDIPGQALEPDISFDLTFTHQFSPRLVLGFSSYTTYQGQPNFALGIGKTTNVGNYVYSTNSVVLGYQWTERFSTATSYTLSAIYYESSAIGTSSNQLEHVIAQQFRYLVLPTVAAAAEYRFNYEQYINTNFNSYSHFVLVGADFTLTPRLQFAFRAGAEFQTDLFHGGTSPTSPYFESTLTYAYRPNSFIQWYNLYDLERSDVDTAKTKNVYRTGLKVLHSFGARLQLGGGLYYSYNHNATQSSFDEHQIEATATASYELTRAWTIQGGYTFSDVLSDITSRSYYRNRVFLGAAFTF
jgi:Putative beta-barrel porin 2